MIKFNQQIKIDSIRLKSNIVNISYDCIQSNSNIFNKIKRNDMMILNDLTVNWLIDWFNHASMNTATNLSIWDNLHYHTYTKKNLMSLTFVCCRWFSDRNFVVVVIQCLFTKNWTVKMSGMEVNFQHKVITKT